MFSNRFKVGSFTCKLSFSDETGMVADWAPSIPRQLSERELAQYRAGRDALLAEVGKSKGGSIVVVET